MLIGINWILFFITFLIIWVGLTLIEFVLLLFYLKHTKNPSAGLGIVMLFFAWFNFVLAIVLSLFII